MELALLDLLVSSGCPPPLYRRFAGLTKQQLLEMPCSQVKTKLREIIPLEELSEDRAGLIRSIIKALLNVSQVEDQSEKVESWNRNSSSIKQENPNSDGEGQRQSSLSPTDRIKADGGDDDIQIIGEVLKSEVAFIGRKLQEQEEILLLEEDDQAEKTDVVVAGASSSSSRKRKICDPIHIRLSALRIQKRRQVSKKKLQKEKSAVGCDADFAWDTVNLLQLENQKDKIDSLECNSWTWNWKENTSTYTLSKMIKLGGPCSGISQLTILSNSVKALKSPCQVDLPNLTRLKAQQKGNSKINYTPLLLSIMETSKLEEIEFSAENEIGIRAFLQILAECAPSLASLKILSLRNDLALVALTTTEVISLSQIQLVGLEELNLGFNLAADIKLDTILANFAPSLKKFTVAGCYTIDASVEAQIRVSVPRMPCLEVMELGNAERFPGGEFETTNKRPPKKKSKSFRVEPQMDSGGGVVSPVTTPQPDATAVEIFRVVLILPALPKLRRLFLSSFYSLQGFHFSLFPTLEEFVVGSDWHLSLPNKPIPVNGRKVYNKLTTLRFPDRLTDHTFMSKIPVFFPNVEKLVLNLPSVKVLRALAKTMKDVMSFKRLEVRTQFDFASSLDYCFFPDSTNISQTDAEIQKMQILNEYKYHQDYVTEYHVERPSFDADGEEFQGLGALKEKFKGRGRYLFWKHVPRTLRLPKGNYHWNDDRCEFTDTLIGYRTFAISDIVLEHLPSEFAHNGLEHPKLTVWDSIAKKLPMTLASFRVTGEDSYFVKKVEVAM